ncbi:calcium/sodium antiporter [Candidatus Saccharibacteria bacterium]|nr:calcium/sodium antiporter [Candidatus Saccharibacteria bacterium]
MVFLQILLLIVGFVLLIKVADFFVDGASSTASNFKVSKSLIGLTIVAFGTSAPELAVSIKALASGSTDMVLGNVIGSNILNILLILGLAAVIRPLSIRKDTIRKEIPICILISSLLVVLFLDSQLNSAEINQITRSDGIAILLFFAIFLYYLISMALHSKDKNKREKPKWKLGKSLFFTLLGLAGIVFGSNFVVDSATFLAGAIGISERVIALSVIALGTSLPELVTTVVASRKGENELALGNILGSNIFNICIVLGVPVAIFGSVTPESFAVLDLVALVGSAALLFVFSVTNHKINRFEGAMMLTIFAAYYATVFLS